MKFKYPLLAVLLLLGGLLCWSWMGTAMRTTVIQPVNADNTNEMTPLTGRSSVEKTPVVDMQTLPPPAFIPPADPQLKFLRDHLLRPWREVKTEADAFRQQTAMGDLARMRTPEATRILAELLFADKETFYVIQHINGIKNKSVSYSVMIYLYKILEDAPMPLEGRNYSDADLPVWQSWWQANHDQLKFRDPAKPIPLPPGFQVERKDGKK